MRFPWRSSYLQVCPGDWFSTAVMQTSRTSAFRLSWQPAAEWHGCLHVFLPTVRTSTLRRLACRFALALQHEGVSIDRATWRGDLSLRAISDAPGKSATGPAGPAGEGPNVTSSQDGTLTRLDRQASRQLHEQDYITNGTLTDPEVKSSDLWC